MLQCSPWSAARYRCHSASTRYQLSMPDVESGTGVVDPSRLIDAPRWPRLQAMTKSQSQPAEVAAYFQGNEHTDYQARMIRECGQRVKTYPFERVVTNPYLLACHHSFCPNCQRRRAQNWASALRAVIDEESAPASKSDSRLGPHWIAITLPGVPCAASELRYEREYSVSRIGEDLPESLSGNRGLELLPWHLAK